GPDQPFFLVDSQNLAEIGRPVAEYGEVLSHALFQQAENQAFRQAHRNDLLQPAGPHGVVETARLADCAGAITHLFWAGLAHFQVPLASWNSSSTSLPA